MSSWCGIHDKPRKYKKYPPVVCYNTVPEANVSKAKYDAERLDALLGDCIIDLIVPKKCAKTWVLQKGDLCRISIIEGSQVGDLNFWNLQDHKERFYSGKTRQIHSAHLSTYDRLWSCFPYLRPMATIVADSLKSYGIDEDGASVHDVIGTRCDDYTYELITGKTRLNSCHNNLRNSIKEHGLEESDVHDVWNIFMCTGFSKDTHQYFCKPSPATKGDYIEFIADMDLLVCLSACPQGNVSIPVGEDVPDELCHPLGVKVYRKKCNTEGV